MTAAIEDATRRATSSTLACDARCAACEEVATRARAGDESSNVDFWVDISERLMTSARDVDDARADAETRGKLVTTAFATCGAIGRACVAGRAFVDDLVSRCARGDLSLIHISEPTRRS